MSRAAERCVRVGVDLRLASCGPEVGYALATLLEIAGFAYEMIWVDDPAAWARGREDRLDLFYGPNPEASAARVQLAWNGLDFRDAPQCEPRSLRMADGVPQLEFTAAAPEAPQLEDGLLRVATDAVFASYWWLTGAREPSYRRDRWDNLVLDGRFAAQFDLPSTPGVSLHAAAIRDHLVRCGLEPLRPEWADEPGCFGLAISHDVDYPQIIRWVEALRMLRARGVSALGPMPGLLASADSFWKFAEWVELAESLGTRPAFYFMARRGSLLRFLRGDPDAFYNIESPRFQRLFGELRDSGCEIGLHASYRACEHPERFAAEKERLERASGGEVVGNRHHYWRLRPDDPNDSLRAHEAAGFEYDSSLAFEFYPGFRRGTCHPFRPFHPGERRVLDLIELPPSWMDDHYDSRLVRNEVADPNADARELLGAIQRTGGIALVDYHVRGMNRDFFPRWGAWLQDFFESDLPGGATPATPIELARAARAHAERIDRASTPLPALAGVAA